MAFKLSQRSINNLKGVHPDMVKLVTRALALSTVDFGVICGVRTLAEQKKLYAQGRTAPGNVVTWTLKSNHFVNPKTGYGHAVDLFPGTWTDLSKFDAMAKAMFAASKELGIAIRWGADWDRDGKPREKGETDSPHFELFGY